ncbi:hypothetical protein [Pedobacter alpinus]|uniref:Uncharacterized protein n=1 Tax=Pedobacter alpinus TaxID=1590643 RepID=A0ABW5TQP0_9SPHI
MINPHLHQSSRNGTKAVLQLRKKRLSMGLPFMINTEEIEKNTCYLEYPDGTITKVAVSKSGIEFQTLEKLSTLEANELRTSFSLI